MQALFLVLTGVLLAGAIPEQNPVEILHLGDGREIKAPIVKETAEKIYVDLGFTIIGIPKKDVVRREAVNAETAAAGSESVEVEKGGLWRAESRREASVKENVERVAAAVVHVKTPSGSGSGFLINPDGYVITNDHVIQGETQVEVTIFEKEDGGLRKRKVKDVRIVGMNGYADLALLKLEGEEMKDLPFVPLGAGEYRVGETVFAIGNPLGMERSVSEGIVSTLNRPFEGLTYLQTTTQINPGNSGGPLFNLKGEVVGVTNMGYMFSEGLNFAIPVERVKWFLRNRQAFAYDKDNPNTGYRYLVPPRKRKVPEDEDSNKGPEAGVKTEKEAVDTAKKDKNETR
jgi:serine protease Do